MEYIFYFVYIFVNENIIISIIYIFYGDYF